MQNNSVDFSAPDAEQQQAIDAYQQEKSTEEAAGALERLEERTAGELEAKGESAAGKSFLDSNIGKALKDRDKT